jgi:hypothetical protein
LGHTGSRKIRASRDDTRSPSVAARGGTNALAFFFLSFLEAADIKLMEAPVVDNAITFTVTSTHGDSRSGTLTSRGKEITTPCFLVHTTKGSPQNFTPDIAKHVELLGALQVDVADLYEGFFFSILFVCFFVCLALTVGCFSVLWQSGIHGSFNKKQNGNR